MNLQKYWGSLSFLSSIGFVVLLILMLRQLDLDSQLLGSLQRIESTGAIGFLVLIYGVVLGSFAIVLAETVGATVAFFLGRTMFKNKVMLKLNGRKKIKNTLQLLRANDWQLVALLRMIPFFPFKLSNYLLGVTPVTTSTYIKGTFVGLWPISVFNVYLGSLANDLISLDQSNGYGTPTNWVYTLAGVLFTGLIVGLIVHRASTVFAEIKSKQVNEK